MNDNPTMDIRVDAESNFIELTVFGIIRITDFEQLPARLIATEGFTRNMNSLIDLRNAKFDSNTEDMERVAAMFLSSQIERGHSFRTALLVKDDLSFGLCRMLAVELEQVPIHAFVTKSYDDACEWVARPNESLESSESA
ncbi:MAG: hypothetical protein JXX29_17650 [Deltaproteobacteria bacterium]|nr:hypothetical protein [Deltaproteobacteria bacterium]MBN2673510.1 hypothetical protein [Deltaproteobacteria bacterium]